MLEDIPTPPWPSMVCIFRHGDALKVPQRLPEVLSINQQAKAKVEHTIRELMCRYK